MNQEEKKLFLTLTKYLKNVFKIFLVLKHIIEFCKKHHIALTSLTSIATAGLVAFNINQSFIIADKIKNDTINIPAWLHATKKATILLEACQGLKNSPDYNPNEKIFLEIVEVYDYNTSNPTAKPIKTARLNEKGQYEDVLDIVKKRPQADLNYSRFMSDIEQSLKTKQAQYFSMEDIEKKDFAHYKNSFRTPRKVDNTLMCGNFYVKVNGLYAIAKEDKGRLFIIMIGLDEELTEHNCLTKTELKYTIAHNNCKSELEIFIQ